MKTQLITIQKQDLFTTSKIVSDNTFVSHSNIQKILNKYRERFERFGELKVGFEIRPSKTNQQEKIYYLNEPQATFLITFLRNTDTVLDFKEKLVKEFFKMRKILNSVIINKQNQEWVQKRESGKIERKKETDIIKEFVEYAKKQGSRSAERYYMNYTKLENTSLFVLGDIFKSKKGLNVRDYLTHYQLNNISTADQIVAKAIKEGMEQELYYKDVYKLAKKRLALLTESLGKSPVPSLEVEEV